MVREIGEDGTKRLMLYGATVENATAIAASRDELSGEFRLNPQSNGVLLEDHVGRQVQVTGSVASSEVASHSFPTMRVVSVTRLTDSCADRAPTP